MFKRPSALAPIAIGCLLAIAPASQLLASDSSPVQSVNSIAAIVNKSVITEYQVQQAMQNVKKHMQQAHITPPPDSVIHKQVLKQLIDEEIQLQMADRAGIKVSDKELDHAIANIAKANKITVADLKTKVIQQGESYASFRRDIRKQVLVSKVQREAVAGKIDISNAKVNKVISEFNKAQRSQVQYHLADILIPLPENASDVQIANAQNRAEDVYKKLKSGASFAKTAKLESASNDGESDGDLGWKSSTELPDLFLDQVHNLRIGQFTKPIRAGNGFHILKVLGVKNSDKKLSKKKARMIVGEKAFKQAVDKWLAGVKKSAYIKVLKP